MSINFEIGNITDIIYRAVREIGIEIAQTAPKFAVCILIVLVGILAVKGVNMLIKFVLEKGRIEEFIKRMTGTYIPLTRITIILADLGIALAIIAGILHLIAPELVTAYNEGLNYVARFVSVIILSLIAILGLTSLVSLVRIEEKLKSFVMLMAFLLILSLLIDLTALSSEIKSALVNGISIGIGLSIGVFALWFFFGEYIEERLKRREEGQESQHEC